ncbi:hypothetical protein PJP10_17915 [Mycobacterium kansasii]
MTGPGAASLGEPKHQGAHEHVLHRLRSIELSPMARTGSQIDADARSDNAYRNGFPPGQ